MGRTFMNRICSTWCFSALVTMLVSATVVASGQQVVTEKFDEEHWNILSGKVETHLGRTAFMGTAVLKDATLKNGIIEVDIAVKHQRSYPGVVFRMQSEENFERFYIRPHRAPFYPDALQYTPTFNKVAGWQLYHGDGYTAAAEIPSDRWNRLRIEIKASRARVFWNDMNQPVLEIHELKHGELSGGLGLLGPADSSAWFSNFRYEETEELTFAPLEKETAGENIISQWELSKAFPAGALDIEEISYPRFYTIYGAGWETVKTEPGGLLDICRYREWPEDRSACALLRHITYAPERKDVKMQFGYSDEVTVFLNGRKLFYGMSAYQGRDPSFLGAVGYNDAVILPLEPGLNEIFFIVKDSFGGWGAMARTDVPLGEPVWQSDRLEKVWETDPVFTTPESVVWDDRFQRFYVTNFDNRANLTETDPAKYTGYISILDPKGKIIEERWAQGLHAPAGMVIVGDTLFTAERRTITAINRKTGVVLQRFPIPNSDFPNDIAAGPDGTLYITDTAPSDPFKSRVYRFKNGTCEIWRSGEEVWRPNAIFVHDHRLIFGGNPGDGNLKAVDLACGRMQKIASLGAGVIDGIKVLPEGGFLVSHWEGRIYEITPGGAVTVLADFTGSFNVADFEFVPEKQLMVIPTFVDNRVVAYRLRGQGD